MLELDHRERGFQFMPKGFHLIRHVS